MSLSLVGSAINTLLVDLLNQRRHQAARPDEGGTLRAQSDAAGNPTTGGPSFGQSSTADVAGATPASWPSSSAYLQSAMSTDLSIVMIALPTDPGGYGASSSGGHPGQIASSTVAPTISSTSLLEDLTSLLSSAMSGDAGGTESAAAALQADIENVSGVVTDSATVAAAKGTQIASHSGFGQRIGAVQSGDPTAAKPAATGPTKNTQATVGSHHRNAGRVSAQPTISAAPSGATGVSQPPPAPATGSESALLAAARQAYDLLMSFASANAE